MNNINFDNPWLLLVFLPFLLIAIVPFCISVRKSNRNVHNVLSLILHIAIAACVTLVCAGINYEATITETNVYVLADVSYSSNNNLDVIDGYVKNIEENLPKNSKLSVIAFAKDYQLLNALGEQTVSVKTAEVDKSATDVAKALR